MRPLRKTDQNGAAIAFSFLVFEIKKKNLRMLAFEKTNQKIDPLIMEKKLFKFDLSQTFVRKPIITRSKQYQTVKTRFWEM